jgi:hypothetical protein
MVTLDPPELVKVSVADWVWLICTLPKLMLEGPAVSDPAFTPVPERAIPKEEFEALLVIATPPVTAPLACGANAMLKLVLCPAVSVKGSVIPLTLNPGPVAPA